MKVNIKKKDVQTVQKFVVKHKVKLLTGAVVVLAIRNRSLKKENTELMFQLDLAQQQASQPVVTPSMFDRIFGQRG